MSEAEFLDELGAWALGGLDAERAARMEQYVAEHPEIRAEVKRAFTAAAALGRALPPSPAPPGAWGRLEAALAVEGDVAGRTASTSPRPSRRGTAIAWMVAAAAAILAIWLWIDRGTRLDREEKLARDLSALQGRDALVDETIALLELAGTQVIPLDPISPELKVAANAVYHRGVKRAYVVVKGLPRETAGYRIWVNRDGQRLEAGRVAIDREGGVIASVAANSLDDVPESFEITRDNGELVLQSHVKI